MNNFIEGCRDDVTGG